MSDIDFKSLFSEVNTISEDIRFDKCRIERPISIKDEASHVTEQEINVFVGEFKCALYEENTSTTITVQTEIDRTPEKVFKLHLKKGIDIKAGDYIYIYKNFYLGEENPPQEFNVDYPVNLKTHIETVLIPNMEV